MILVDDGSNDDTLHIINEYKAIYPQIRFYSRNREPQSASTCRNIGAKYAVGKYLVFLDSDDILLPDCLKRRVDFMDKHHRYYFAVFPTATFEESHHKISLVNLNQAKENYIYEFISSSAPWQTTAPIWRRDFFFEVSGFDERYQRLQDVEFTIKALLKAENQYYVYEGKDHDYLYRTSYRVQNEELLKAVRLSYDAFYEWVQTLAEQIDNKRKYEIALLRLLIAQSYCEFIYPDKDRIRRLISELEKRTGTNFSHFDYWIFKFSTCTIGYYQMYVWRGYLMEVYRRQIYDQPKQNFIVWLASKLVSKYRKN